MLTSRELPPTEWPRLDGTELERMWPVLDPDHATVVVVEDEAGMIVGTWAVMAVVHAEGFGVSLAHRQDSRVLRLLMKTGHRVMARLGIASFVTAASTPEMATYLTRLQGIELPARFFTVPLRGTFGRIASTKET
jgi:hypothetical protein